MNVNQFEFVIESDWSSGHSGYMLFGCRDGEQRLLDIGSKAHGLVTSSNLGGLDAIVWACKRTKAYRAAVPLVIRTYSRSLYPKAKSGNFYDPDVRAFRRWAWLVANEPGFRIKFVHGAENLGADLLSRPVCKKGDIRKEESDTCGVIQVPEQVSLEALARLVWDEHLKAHWGAFRIYHALRRQGIPASWKFVKVICATCEICAKFRRQMKRREWSQPPYSTIPEHTLYLDVVGPLIPGRGGVQYIQCCLRSLDAISPDAPALLPRTRFWLFRRRFIIAETDFTDRTIRKALCSRTVRGAHKLFFCPKGCLFIARRPGICPSV